MATSFQIAGMARLNLTHQSAQRFFKGITPPQDRYKLFYWQIKPHFLMVPLVFLCVLRVLCERLVFGFTH
jgi:hypothetical protein